MERPKPPKAADGEVITKLVYQHQTGEILHVHSVMVVSGAEAPSEAAIEAEARVLASEIKGTPEAEAGVLTIQLDDLAHGVTYAVDPNTRRLVVRSPAPGSPETSGA
jgi:hypothetical protein